MGPVQVISPYWFAHFTFRRPIICEHYIAQTQYS